MSLISAVTTKALAWVCAALALVLLVSHLIWGMAYLNVLRQRDAASAERDRLRADVAAQRADFEAAARTREREQSLALAGVSDIFDQELSNAETAHASVVAELHADNLRLRRHWQGCVSAAELPAAAPATGSVDEAAALRATGAADLVRAARECDATVRGLQAVIETYQGSLQ